MSAGTSIYLIGSLRHARVREVSSALRDQGYDVFDDWHAAGPAADDIWREYEQEREHGYLEALDGFHAQHVFKFDQYHLNRCTMGVLVLPAGRSGHLELGVMLGQGKPGFILLEGKDPERWDVMYKFATAVVSNIDDLIAEVAVA